VPDPLSVSVSVIVPLPGDAPHWAIHAADRRTPGNGDQTRLPSCCHVNDRPVGTACGAVPTPMLSVTNTNSNEFAAGLIDAVVYDVRSTLSYAAVSSVAPIAT
jgi:hypothetical protein